MLELMLTRLGVPQVFANACSGGISTEIYDVPHELVKIKSGNDGIMNELRYGPDWKV